MQIKKFRGVEFINREKEISFFLDYFQTSPERILWVYGQKSTGKTTLIEYILEKKLNPKEYNIKYLNFRRTLVSNFNNFIESFLEEKDEDEVQTELNRNYNLFGLFRLEAKTLKKIKENRKNIFVYLFEEFNKEKRKNLFIIDEIQALEDIYINGDKKLLNEFLNFCISLTKESHLSHVLILTSNTIFLDQIYNNAKMEKTSSFVKIEHLEYNEIKEWLKDKFSSEEIELIYEYFGGCVSDIKNLMISYKYSASLKEYLEKEARIAKNKLIYLIRKYFKKDDIKIFAKIIKIILEKGFYEGGVENIENDVINIMSEQEVFFYDPLENKITSNSKIYEKAFELILKEI